MKQITLFLLALCSCFLVKAQTSGGPDTYGYTWKSHADTAADAPTYSWIDIIGLPDTDTIAGLDDDNVVGPFSIGFDFPFYWVTFNSLSIGSNGYISFDFINISSTTIGFPTLPTADSKDKLIAPFLTDLSFATAQTSSPNPGRCYMYSNNQDTCIITYENVPFWTNITQQWSGSNTFQVIMSKVDSSILFQYKTQTGSWDPTYNGRLNPGVVGIENMTGTIGLQVSNNTRPVASSAIKFYYPKNVTFVAKDVATGYVVNPQNAGFFVPGGGAPFKGFAQIDNVGNVAINSIIGVQLKVLDPGLTVLHTDAASIGSLGIGGSTGASFNLGYTPTIPNHYSYRVIATTTGDINRTNDSLDLEMIVIDTTQKSMTLSYWNGFTTTAGASINWASGGSTHGIGMYMEPPIESIEITSVDAFITSAINLVGPNAFEVRIYDDDGPPGQGTLLGSQFFVGTGVAANNWNRVTFSSPIRIDSGGFYVGWYQTGSTINLGMETVGPLANRGYEILNNAWADYRSNSGQDPMVRVNADKICQVKTPVNLGLDTMLCSGNTLVLDAGAGLANYSWSNGSSSRTLSITTPGTYYVDVEDSVFCTGTDTIVVGLLPSPTVDLGPDHSFCDGDSVILDAGAGHTGYLWSDGTTNQSLTVKLTGVYSVTVSNTDGCTATDDVIVAVNLNPTIDLGQDLDGCKGDVFTLMAGLGFQSYSWSDGSAMADLMVSSSGTYWVTVLDANGCSGSDTVNVFIGGGDVNLGADTTICEGGSAVLDAGAGFGAYIWSTGSTNQSITVTTGGTYSVTVIDGVCQGIDTVVVTENPLPVPNFTVVPTGNPQRFAFQNSTQFGISYTWDFGGGNTSSSTSPLYTFPVPGNYVVCMTAINACGDRQHCDTIMTGNTGLERELFAENITLFPVPTSERLYIDFQGITLNDVNLTLYDLKGKRLLANQIGDIHSDRRIELNVNELPAGVYYLQLQTAQHIIARKVVVQ